MKENPQKPYRFYRPRRPEGIGSGLRLEGVTPIFGLVGSALLMIIGLAMLVVRDAMDEKAIVQVEIVLQAPPFHSPKIRNSILLSVTNARVITLDPASYAAADQKLLMSLKKGDVLMAGMPLKDSKKWKENEGRKDYFKVLTLQKKDGSWIVSFSDYRQKAGGNSSQGFWVILLGLVFAPYPFISNPRFPIWAALVLYFIALTAYYLI